MKYYKVIGWTSNDDKKYPEVTDGERISKLRSTIINEIRDKGYKFSGSSHYYLPNCTPVLNSGEKYCLPYREWAALMAQAWHEDNSDGYGYLFWVDDMFDKTQFFLHPEERCKYPPVGVCTEKIVRKNRLKYEPELNEKIYSSSAIIHTGFYNNKYICAGTTDACHGRNHDEINGTSNISRSNKIDNHTNAFLGMIRKLGNTLSKLTRKSSKD